MAPDLPDQTGARLFKGLPDRVVAGLVRNAQRRHLRRGTLLYSEGAPADALHMLTSGFVKMTHSAADGARVILQYVGPGEPFGTPAFVRDGRYRSDAVAATNVVELQWPSRVLRTALFEHPQLAVNACALLEARLRDLEGRLIELSKERVELRLARCVLRIVRKRGRTLSGRLEVPFPVTRQDLADMTATTLHTVSRILGAWERQGFVERGRERVVVTNSEALNSLIIAGNTA